MANIRIKDLPSDSAPSQNDIIPIDLAGTRGATVKDVVESGRPTASKTEAELGVDPQKAMTPLTTKQAIDAQVSAAYVPKTVKVNAGDGLNGGGELSGDVTVGLSTASIASLANADSAVQSVNGKSGNTVVITPSDVGAAPDTVITDINENTAARHTHENKAILDATTASFLADEKAKLAGIEAGAQVNTVNSVNTKTGAVVLNADDVGSVPDTFIDDIEANTLARHTHSNKAILDATTASFLAAEKTKLSGIEAGAQVNTVTSVAGKSGAVTLVKEDVGLDNVDNTSDINKPISAATQNALDGKYDNPAGTTSQYIRGDGSLSAFPAIPQGTVTSVGLTVPTGLSASGSPVTSSGTIAISYANGYQGYTSAEASKLAGIAAGAQVNTVTSVAGKTGEITLVKGDVGLGNVDNTSDANKPISAATQTALNAKANSSVTVSAGAGLTGGGNLTANRSIALNAASIASLEKADTALQAPGGSTGQILAKSSDTDNDVGWVSSEAATAVSYGPQTLTEAQQGQARANIGADILAGFRNKIINGDFDIWQRGPSLPLGTGTRYAADRWIAGSNGSTISVSRTAMGAGQEDVPGNPAFGTRLTVASVSGASNYALFVQRIEGVRTLSGKKATVTFYAKADAAKPIALELGQVFGSGGTPSGSVQAIGAQKFNLTTSWQKFSVVIDIPSIAGKSYGTDGNDFLSLTLWFDAGSTFDSRSDTLGQRSGTYDIAHVSIVEGDATAEDDPFSPRHIQQETALCQRYFERQALFFGASMPGAHQGFGMSVAYSVRKRVSPSITFEAVTYLNASGLSAGSIAAGGFRSTAISEASGAVQFTATAAIDAEL